MPTYQAVRNPDRCPSLPGAVLSDILDDLKIPKAEIAQRLGISRQHFCDILTERKPHSPKVAAMISKMFGEVVGTRLLIQANYDAWNAEQEVDVSHLRSLKAV
jgi:antitoxin HigA-1